jgi:deoxyribodipyrimidine photolyase
MFALLLPDNHAHYDSLQGLYGWAKDSLTLHSADPRAHLYSLAQLEAGNTHDDLWNAAQLQVVRDGKMHVSRPTSESPGLNAL